MTVDFPQPTTALVPFRIFVKATAASTSNSPTCFSSHPSFRPTNRPSPTATATTTAILIHIVYTGAVSNLIPRRHVTTAASNTSSPTQRVLAVPDSDAQPKYSQSLGRVRRE